MDIEIKVTPRIIERVIFIIVVIILIISNIHFYNKSKIVSTKTDTSEEKSQDISNVTSEVKTTENQTKKETASNITEKNDTEFEPSTSPPPGRTDCVAGWKCYKPYYKGYQKADCKWINVQVCLGGCEDGKCKPEPLPAETEE